MPGQGESNVYDAALNALAGKLYYEGKDGHLTGKVEVAEGLMAEAWSKDISFKADGQGEYKAQKSEKPSGPVVPPGSNPIPAAPSADEGQTNTTFIKGELNGIPGITFSNDFAKYNVCLLYTSDAADERYTV